MKKLVQDFIEDVKSLNLPLHGILVDIDGEVLHEEYFHPYDSGRLHRMFSVTKSFTAVAVGFAVHEGLFSLEDRVSDYFPEFITENTEEPILEMKVKDLLTMRTCHRGTTYDKSSRTENWVGSFFRRHPHHRSGTIFFYDTSASHVLGALIEKRSGEDLITYMKTRFLTELGISDSCHILKDPFGVSIAGSGLMARPLDLQIFGRSLLSFLRGDSASSPYDAIRTYLENAVSPQVSPLMTAGHMSRFGYGYQFWMIPGGYGMLGLGSQLVLSYPEENLLIVITGDTRSIPSGDDLILAAADRLRRRISEVKGLRKKEAAFTEFPGITGSFSLRENPAGFECIEIQTGDEDSLLLKKKGEAFRLPLTKKETVFPHSNLRYTAEGGMVSEGTYYAKLSFSEERNFSIQIKLALREPYATLLIQNSDDGLLDEFRGCFIGERKF